jgi:integrase
MNNFEQLAENALTKIKDFGTTSRTVIKCFERSCRMINSFLEEHNLEFSIENGEKWLSVTKYQESETHYQHTLFLSHRRAVFLLFECQQENLDYWRIYPVKEAARPQTIAYKQLIHLHESRLFLEGKSKSTISFSLYVDSIFLIYLEQLGVNDISEVTAQMVSDFFTQDMFSNRKPDGIKAYSHKLKGFLVFLGDMGLVSNEMLHLAIPRIFAQQVSIVTTLSKKAEQQLISEEKLSSDIGSRDHAMILLALRLGIRRSDIINLKLQDIDWKNDTITFVQQKTKVPVTLPLLTDVGNAVMNYILKSRKATDKENIFLRKYAPHTALKSGAHTVEKYLKNLDYDDCPQKGFHILRRTLATRMLENNVPCNIISASIGQIDPASVDVYLATNAEKMRSCALPLQGIESVRRELQ